MQIGEEHTPELYNDLSSHFRFKRPADDHSLRFRVRRAVPNCMKIINRPPKFYFHSHPGLNQPTSHSIPLTRSFCQKGLLPFLALLAAGCLRSKTQCLWPKVIPSCFLKNSSQVGLFWFDPGYCNTEQTHISISTQMCSSAAKRIKVLSSI